MKSRIKETDQRVGEEDSGSDDEEENNEEEGVDVTRQAKSRVLSVLGQFLREGGDESGREGSFGKEVSEKVGDPEGGDEGVEFASGPEKGIEENFPDETENARGPDGSHDAGGAFGAHEEAIA